MENQGAIGGPDIIVEIDQTLFAHKKHEWGCVIAQVWVFGVFLCDHQYSVHCTFVNRELLGYVSDSGTFLV